MYCRICYSVVIDYARSCNSKSDGITKHYYVALTNRKLKSPLDSKVYTTSDAVRKIPHIPIFFVCPLKDSPVILKVVE